MRARGVALDYFSGTPQKIANPRARTEKQRGGLWRTRSPEYPQVSNSIRTCSNLTGPELDYNIITYYGVIKGGTFTPKRFKSHKSSPPDPTVFVVASENAQL